ncbi:hypothetical protein A2419_01520 [Candidatus Adlerbacteria bacterium RIFOXYC1_FULL_48_26]|uniref:Uncharacterized protein n=1 Tax=Candidatus Adlerbacteria bacterium RIFOXYC1_FULL_48_26 TaxID=1797247 RepID=A0A1F4Y2D0_9BACT|nr:MAG: hypothetical protein A2419_01520 [Candidatus Adlerbacteria bacterium RIFOXYC1_FULL_48_26]OGC93946.1 MAG: hypothetical protein A2389_00410 [Candidatus Adlerbacteria bacterium RIFOXYB1_FULL_48_10]OGC96723.1 MAG: hypothetical protein A2590_02665 [Candidatus Adlerbacteria bacterium RIFOXYD1_FULL_48_8]
MDALSTSEPRQRCVEDISEALDKAARELHELAHKLRLHPGMAANFRAALPEAGPPEVVVEVTVCMVTAGATFAAVWEDGVVKPRQSNLHGV